MMKITGIPEIDKKLLELEPKVAKKVIRQAERKSLKPVAKEAKGKAPKLTGALRKNLKVKSGKRSRVSINMDVAIGDGFFKGDQFYGYMQEFGWRAGPRRTKKGHYRKNRKQVKPKFFIRGTYEAQKKRTKDKAIELITKGIEEQAAQ